MRENHCFKKSVKSVHLFLLLTIISCAVFICGAAAAENEIVVQDSVSPLKLDLQLDYSNSTGSTTGSTIGNTVSKTVYIRNTGDTSLNYIFYLDQSEKTGVLPLFSLSESSVSLEPGQSYSLTVSVQTNPVKSESDFSDVKLKIIRNPESTTPVGYVVPIHITTTEENSTGNGSGNSGSGSNSTNRTNSNNNTKNTSSNSTNSTNSNIIHNSSGSSNNTDSINMANGHDSTESSDIFQNPKRSVMIFSISLILSFLISACFMFIVYRRYFPKK
ncbi:hypothetical protein [Methanolapillus millepedarum]|uniref:Uncharacterized protein n=1 Tax=Methanolapillus millepedarum TaxID=3028296 RepID=A0AA96V6T2_9EURY|nr:hypothetical protein MsAc7_17970 [Methanosarcinaceae archaeon Ac7]